MKNKSAKKYWLCLIIIPFMGLFFATQDYGHAGTLKGADYSYTGALKNGRPEGIGTMTYTNGNSYTGAFVDGDFSGEGKLVNKVEKWTYTGVFSDGVPDGKGKMNLPDGTTRAVLFDKGTLVK
ncbi:MAG: hypothetical protein LBI11_06305 [Streptococcaceae bacterium]|jgi:hypothetical protein|nr:hypothetical protein [Streptococcaceae bacterium]